MDFYPVQGSNPLKLTTSRVCLRINPVRPIFKTGQTIRKARISSIVWWKVWSNKKNLLKIFCLLADLTKTNLMRVIWWIHNKNILRKGWIYKRRPKRNLKMAGLSKTFLRNIRTPVSHITSAITSLKKPKRTFLATKITVRSSKNWLTPRKRRSLDGEFPKRNLFRRIYLDKNLLLITLISLLTSIQTTHSMNQTKTNQRSR